MLSIQLTSFQKGVGMQKNKQEHVVFIVTIDDKISMAAFSSAVIVNFLPWIPVHSDENQQEQGSRAKH